MKQVIIIVDYGCQYTQLIARRIRELNTFCLVQTSTVPTLEIESGDEVIGIILSGGPESVYAEEALHIPTWVFDLNAQRVPILGICYGMQILAKHFGGKVQPAQIHEFGHARVKTVDSDLLTIESEEQHEWDVWMSHADEVCELPQGFKVTASSKDCRIAAMEKPEQRIYAVQFHPEVTHTPDGFKILKQFCHAICQSDQTWKSTLIVDELCKKIIDQIGDDQVILGLSGGVDSTVTAALLHKAIPKQLQCVFIDNGLLRQNEAELVKQAFSSHFDLNLSFIDAKEQFMQSLAGIDDPEAKRKAIGATFVEVFQQFAQQFAKKQSSISWLAQGTIYSDIIESAGEESGKVIKSHHNVGGLPQAMDLNIIEPLRKLFKDEVRQLGSCLGLPANMLNRHPFPGPGLGIRILGEVNQQKANILRKADAIFIDELHRANYYEKISQAFCVFLPVKSVGVVGDYRRYQWVIAIRAVQSTDFMTAEAADLPFELLQQVSNRIVNEISDISRVVYDISSKPPATIEWE